MTCDALMATIYSFQFVAQARFFARADSSFVIRHSSFVIFHVMIPREILKKIRQIELCTNRIVTAFAAGARASARFTARTPAASKTNPALNSICPLKRRERRAPAAPERGCVPSTSRSTPTNHHALRLGLRPQPRPVPASRNSKPIEFGRFGNCGEFATIKTIISPN
jgi:hypothetical protein